MATTADPSAVSDMAILSRLIRPEDDTFSPEAAEALLLIRFDQRDLDRMHELALKNQDDCLTPAEHEDMENYRRVSFLLDLMRSKARRALKTQRAVR